MNRSLSLAVAVWLAAVPAHALPQDGPPTRQRDAAVVPEGARDIGFDQNLGGQVPLDLTFRDETGKSVRFGDLLRGRPVVLSVVYYECPMLCTLVLNGVVSALKPVDPRAGDATST